MKPSQVVACLATNSVSYDAHGQRARVATSVLGCNLRIHMVRSCDGEDLAGVDMTVANMVGAR